VLNNRPLKEPGWISWLLSHNLNQSNPCFPYISNQSI
jgi:hypothetical protein